MLLFILIYKIIFLLGKHAWPVKLSRLKLQFWRINYASALRPLRP